MVCFYGYGTIILNVDCKTQHPSSVDKIKDLLLKYDKTASFRCEYGLLQFMSYTNMNFISDLQELLEKHVDEFDTGKIEFDTTETWPYRHEFGSPGKIYIEIYNGNVVQQILYRRLGMEWNMECGDDEWFFMENKRRREREKEELDRRNKEAAERREQMIADGTWNEPPSDEIPF